jgi:hypothetical protein
LTSERNEDAGGRELSPTLEGLRSRRRWRPQADITPLSPSDTRAARFRRKRGRVSLLDDSDTRARLLPDEARQHPTELKVDAIARGWSECLLLGAQVANTVGAAGDRVDRRAVGRAVVGQHTLNGDAVAGVEGDRAEG